MWTNLFSFLEVGDHYNGCHVLVPNHSPEIIDGRFLWSLSCYELAFVLVTLATTNAPKHDDHVIICLRSKSPPDSSLLRCHCYKKQTKQNLRQQMRR